MTWGSPAEFFSMGGYGLYVWGAYAVTAALVGAELVILVRSGRTLRRASGRSPRPNDHTR